LWQSQVRAALPNVFSHLVCSTTRFRAGEAKDESFYVAGVREVLDLEGTFTWSDKEADEQRRVWRETLLRGGALVADNTAGKPVAFVTVKTNLFFLFFFLCFFFFFCSGLAALGKLFLRLTARSG
jgi:hypothetical protein